jgi:hypothetical protein
MSGMQEQGLQPERPGNRFIGFRVGVSEYAIELEHISGLADCGPIRKVDGTPTEILGLVEWRGRILTVLDLPALLGKPPCDGPMCLIRLSGSMARTALSVPAPVSFLSADHNLPGSDVAMIDPAELVSQLETEILAGSSAPGD